MAADVERDALEKTLLKQLNQEYVDAYMKSDVKWYRKHLAEEFVVIESNGLVLNKEQFLQNTARGPDVIEYRLQDVNVRIYANVALVRATGSWTGKNGASGVSRYVDVYVKTDGEWKTVSAQITRTSASNQ